MFLKNILYILVSALLAAASSLLLSHYFQLNTVLWPYSICYFMLLYFLMNLFYASRAAAEDFTQLLFVGIVIKLLMALVIILIFSFRKKDFFGFAMHFISHYVLFTIFEIRYLLNIVKTNSPKNKIP